MTTDRPPNEMPFWLSSLGSLQFSQLSSGAGAPVFAETYQDLPSGNLGNSNHRLSQCMFMPTYTKSSSSMPPRACLPSNRNARVQLEFDQSAFQACVPC